MTLFRMKSNVASVRHQRVAQRHVSAGAGRAAKRVKLGQSDLSVSGATPHASRTHLKAFIVVFKVDVLTPPFLLSRGACSAHQGAANPVQGDLTPFVVVSKREWLCRVLPRHHDVGKAKH